MEDTPSFRGVPIRYFRAQDGVLQICLKDVCEALGMERYDTVAIPIKQWFGVASLGVGAFAEEDGYDRIYTTVTIPQLYFLVFRSYTKRARKFGRWLEAELFPYVMKQSVEKLAKQIKEEL